MLAALLPPLLLTLLILGLPLLGAWLGGQPLEQFLQVPLRNRAFDPLPLDRDLFFATALAAGGLFLSVLWLSRPRARAQVETEPPTRSGGVPAWCWAGALLAAAAPLTGNGPWFGMGLSLFLAGLTLLLNADTRRRAGACLLTKRPGYFAALLPAGALLGWLYHYLNLYLQLWHYPNAPTTATFVLERTLAYAILLPALLSLRQWLASFPTLREATRRARPIRLNSGGTGTGWIAIALGCLGLAGAPLWPDWIWPLTWLAPLLLVLGLQALRAGPTLLAGLGTGDWSRLLLPALSAVIIGFGAQAWNLVAGPIWAFALPLVDDARVLGLAAPAYLGLVPLGLLGIWVGDQLARPWRGSPLGRFPEFPVKIVVKH
jgi:hypothetical protein